MPRAAVATCVHVHPSRRDGLIPGLLRRLGRRRLCVHLLPLELLGFFKARCQHALFGQLSPRRRVAVRAALRSWRSASANWSESVADSSVLSIFSSPSPLRH